MGQTCSNLVIKSCDRCCCVKASSQYLALEKSSCIPLQPQGMCESEHHSHTSYLERRKRVSFYLVDDLYRLKRCLILIINLIPPNCSD